MLVQDLLVRDVVSLRLDRNLHEAMCRMAESGVPLRAVVDLSSRIVGVLTEGDILRYVLAAGDREQSEWNGVLDGSATVADAMTTHPVVVRPDTDVEVAAIILAGSGWMSLPVVAERGLFVGLVSRSHVLRALAHCDGVTRRQRRGDGADRRSHHVANGAVFVP